MAIKKKAPAKKALGKKPFGKKPFGKKPFAKKAGGAGAGAAKAAGKKPMKRYTTKEEARPVGRSGARPAHGVFKRGPRKGGPEEKRPRRGSPPPRRAAAPKSAPRAAPAADRPDTSRPLALAIAKAGLDKKAEQVLLLDVRGLTSYADYFVVMTADSDRQAGAIADHVETEMKAAGVTKVGVEGYEGGRWILVDYGDVVAHVMNKEAREFYDIEGLWADAPRLTIAD
jgi:ribosome-associated protein